MGAQTKKSTCIYFYGKVWRKFISNEVAQRRRLHREPGCHRSWIGSKRGPGWAFLAGRGLRWTRCRPHNQWCPWKLLISLSIGSELLRTCTSSCKSFPSRHCGFCRSSSPRWPCSRSRCCSRSRQGRCCRRRCWRAKGPRMSCWSILVLKYETWSSATMLEFRLQQLLETEKLTTPVNPDHWLFVMIIIFQHPENRKI